MFAEIQSLYEQNHPEYFREPQNDAEFVKFFEQTIADPEQFLDFICVDNTPQGYVHFQIYNRGQNAFSNDRNYA